MAQLPPEELLPATCRQSQHQCVDGRSYRGSSWQHEHSQIATRQILARAHADTADITWSCQFDCKWAIVRLISVEWHASSDTQDRS